MRVYLPVFTFFLFSQIASSQHTEAHYLTVLDSTKNKTIKLAALDSLIQLHKKTNTKAFATYSEAYINLAIDQEKYEDAIKKTIRSSFAFNILLGQGDKALSLLELVEKHISKTTSSRLKGGIYLKKGGVYFNGKNFEKALSNYLLAIDNYGATDSIFIADAIYFKGQANFHLGNHLNAVKDYRLAGTYYSNLGDQDYELETIASIINVFASNGFYKLVIAERDKLIAKKIKINSPVGVTIDYYNQANSYKKIGDVEKQEKLLLLSLKQNLRENNNNNSLSFTYGALAELYMDKGDLIKSRVYLELASKQVSEMKGDNLNTLSFQITESIYYYKSNQLTKALSLALISLKKAKKLKRIGSVLKINKLIYEIYEAKKLNQKALIHYKQYTRIKDSLFNITKANALTYYQTLTEASKKEKQINNQLKTIELLAKENLIKQSLLVFGGIFILLIGLIIFLYRKKSVSLRKRKLKEAYAQKLLQSQENQSKRISKDLHDGLGQSLLLIKNSISKNTNDQTENMVNNAIEEIRTIANSLHPFQLNGIGVTRALENLIEKLDNNYKELYLFGNIENIDNLLNSKQELNTYRIVQECLSNIIKHAQADSAKVSVKKAKKEITIIIKDNGIGFNFSSKYNNKKSLGLKTIKERVKYLNGTVIVNSITDYGTTYKIYLPIP